MSKISILIILFIAAVFAQGGGSALDFDGSDDYVDCGSGTDLQMGTHDLTVEFWLKTSASAIQRIIGNGGTGSTDDGYSVWMLSNGRIRAQCSDATNTVNEVNTNTVNDGNWHHVAVMYDRDGNLTVCIDGACSTADLTSVTGNCDNSSSFVLGVKSASSNTTQPFTGILDEVRIWSAALSEATFEEWMYKPIESGHTNYANLEAYYQMSDGSGTTLTDNSSNTNTGTLNNMDDDDWVSSNAPIGSLTSSYTTDVEGIWSVTGTSNSDASTGLLMSVGSALSTGNFAVFGNNNTSGTSTSDLPDGVDERTGRIWHVDESGTVSADIVIDISDATGNSVTVGTASNYKLLYRSGTSGDFSTGASGASVSGDAITFTSYSLADGYYAMGGTGDASLPVELTSFSANPKTGAVELSWVTESEIDNLGFLVDRSRDPISGFTTIADYRFVPELQGQGSVTYRTDYSYTDTEAISGTKYYYVLSDVTGNPEHGEPVTRHTDKMVNATPLWADSETGILKDFRLLKVYPNPFNPSTMISFDVPLDTKHATHLRVYNIKGQLVEALVNEQMKPGTHKIKWNAVNLLSGIYFVEMRAGDKIFNQKITFIK